MIALLWTVLATGMQAEDFVRKLSDDDIEARHRAAEELVRLGTKARGALEETLKTADPETRARIRSILGEIELTERKAHSLGSTGSVSLPKGEHALREIADLVLKETGITLRVPDSARDARVRVEAREMPLLKFVDLLCRAHGKLTVAPPRSDQEIELVEGEPWIGPVGYSGPFRVWIERLRLERRCPYGEAFERGSMVVALGWQPNVRPVPTDRYGRAANFVLEEIRTESGAVLRPKPWGGPQHGFRLGATQPGRLLHFAGFEHPPSGGRRLATVRGHIDVLLPLRFETVVFERPLASAGKETKVGDYRVVLKKCEATREGLEVLVQIEAPPENDELEKPQQRLEIRSRVDPGSFELVDDVGAVRKGKSILSSNASGSNDEGLRTESHEQRLAFPGDQVPKELRFTFIADYFVRRVEFHFKDVELP